jgi:hypothetical protein
MNNKRVFLSLLLTIVLLSAQVEFVAAQDGTPPQPTIIETTSTVTQAKNGLDKFGNAGINGSVGGPGGKSITVRTILQLWADSVPWGNKHTRAGSAIDANNGAYSVQTKAVLYDSGGGFSLGYSNWCYGVCGPIYTPQYDYPKNTTRIWQGISDGRVQWYSYSTPQLFTDTTPSTSY